MLEMDDFNDLKVLYTQLSLRSEYLYTQVLLKVLDIINRYVDTSRVFVCDKVVMYDDLKLLINVELRMALNLCNKKPSKPFDVSYIVDKGRYEKEARNRLLRTCSLIRQADNLYGVLK